MVGGFPRSEAEGYVFMVTKSIVVSLDGRAHCEPRVEKVFEVFFGEFRSIEVDSSTAPVSLLLRRA
jgi:hypothetical protein